MHDEGCETAGINPTVTITLVLIYPSTFLALLEYGRTCASWSNSTKTFPILLIQFKFNLVDRHKQWHKNSGFASINHTCTESIWQLCKITLSIYRHGIYLLLFTCLNTLFKKNLWYLLLTNVTILVPYFCLYFAHIFFLVSIALPFQLPFTSPLSCKIKQQTSKHWNGFQRGWRVGRGSACWSYLPLSYFYILIRVYHAVKIK